MKLSRTNRERLDIGLVPMINVVFLLLIFLLMTARLVSPPPLDISVPEAESDMARGEADTLYLSRAGVLVFNDSEGEAAALTALTGWAKNCIACQLNLMADQRASARALTSILSKLGAIGIEDITLVTVQK
ncbi:ExbD/TolR family protein [Celeribacter sp.]|uniref:ExbD/TolR family protein n=1 Tax=Celeribacter sp. TaxID=1890673 RepID=UPI003A90752D